MSCSKTEACRCWTVSEHIKVTQEPEFKQFCKENYFIIDDHEDDNKCWEDFKDKDDDGYFTDNELPPDENNEVSDEWLLSHLMDDTSNLNCCLQQVFWQTWKKSMVYAWTEENIAMEEQIPVEFLVDDDMRPMVEDMWSQCHQHSFLLHFSTTTFLRQ